MLKLSLRNLSPPKSKMFLSAFKPFNSSVIKSWPMDNTKRWLFHQIADLFEVHREVILFCLFQNQI